jgi:hypothetical protein
MCFLIQEFLLTFLIQKGERKMVKIFNFIIIFTILTLSGTAFAWSSKGHIYVREWVVTKLPAWQQELFGAGSLDNFCKKYSSLQDKYSSKKYPVLKKYCNVPGLHISLHNLGPARESTEAIQWYLTQFCKNVKSGEKDEALKFLGVLCHWNEDPGSLSAHSCPVSEEVLRQLLPLPENMKNRNYLYGLNWIGLEGGKKTRVPEDDYTPKLLGSSISEAAVRIYQNQKKLKYHNSQYIIPAIQGRIENDFKKSEDAVKKAYLNNAKHVADIVYTAVCLAVNKLIPDEAAALKTQPLTHWLPDYKFRTRPMPYYVTPYLLNKSFDAKRRLHPLVFPATATDSKVQFGYGVGAPSLISWEIAPGNVFTEFTVRAGLHNLAGSKGKVKFIIKVNGKTEKETAVLSAGQAPVFIRIPLPETPVVKLELQTLPEQGSNPRHNLAIWAEPKLLRTVTVPE